MVFENRLVVENCWNLHEIMKNFMNILGEWEHWLKRVEEYIYPNDSVPEFSDILVPNVDNVRTNFLIETIAKQNKVITK